MRKNAINWKRTPLGSSLEVVCPIILMLLIAYGRYAIISSVNLDFPLEVMKHPMFPIARPVMEPLGEVNRDVVTNLILN